MKKKILAAVLSVAMVLSMTACGSAAATTDDGAADSTTTDDAAVSTEAAAEEGTEAGSDVSGEGFKVGLVTDVGGINDGSFNQSAWEGLQKAGEDMGVEVQYLESSGDSDYAPNIESFMDEDYDLIICVGYMLADATRAAAEANPDQKFAIIDDNTCADLDNVSCLMFKQEQGSYLAGYVAGLMTESNNVGFVLGMASETMHLFGYGYVAGVLDANPDCTVQQMNANSFADPETGKTDANAEITNGADIIFHAAGGTGNGVIEACQEAGIYAIGVDSDQSSIAPQTVITSAMKRVDTAVYDTTKSLLEGSLTGGEKIYDINNDGVGIAPTQDLLTDEVIAAVEEVEEKIKSGEIVVPDSKEAFEAAHGDAYELD